MSNIPAGHPLHRRLERIASSSAALPELWETDETASPRCAITISPLGIIVDVFSIHIYIYKANIEQKFIKFLGGV